MISEIIRNRRSVYPVQYNDSPITKEELTKILEAANWAPTHRRTEPWRFKVFHGESQLALGNFLSESYKTNAEKFSERTYNKLKENMAKAGAVIAICMQRDPDESIPEWEEIASTAMAVQNMWLVASQLKIGSYWSSPGVKQYLGNHISLKEGERCLGFFYLGKYDEELPEGTRASDISEKTEWI